MPSFEYIGHVPAEDELGIWEALPAAAPRALQLEGAEAGPPPGPDASMWQVTLPEQRQAADAVLAAAGGRLAVAAAALPYAARRLAVLATTGGPSPTLPLGAEAPEVALYDLAAASQAPGARAVDQGALVQVGAFFDKLRDTLRNYAAIDTRVGGARVGFTLVSWTGDFTTAWPRGLAPDEAQQHAAAVGLALRTRDAWLRLGLTVARGALQIAALFGLNPALALPATYRFVRQVIDQVQGLGRFPALA